MRFALPLLVLCFAACAPAAELDARLTAWLEAQAGIRSWSAAFTQTRALKSLTQPLTATGRVWFTAPNQFRWELGDPAQTIAVRQPEQMLVLYPRLKRVEKYALTGEHTGPWRDMLALFEAGFPRNQTDLESTFKIVSLTTTNGVCELSLQPKAVTARRMMPRLKIVFSTADQALRATELQFADGSTLRNDFDHALVNPPVAPELFVPAIAADFTVSEPMKK